MAVWLHRQASHSDAQRQGQGQAAPNDKGSSEKASDFRLQAAGYDIGAAWNDTNGTGREYKSVTLTIFHSRLRFMPAYIEGEDRTHDLIWWRSKSQTA